MAAVAAGIRHVQAHDQRLRRALRQRQHGQHPGQPRAQDDRARCVPVGGGELADLTELSRSVAEIANIAPNDYQPYVGRSRVRPQGRRPRRRRRQGRAELPARRPGARSATRAGSSSPSSAAGPTPAPGRAARPPARGASTRASSRKLIKQLEADGLAFEGAEASFELLIRRHAADYARAVPDRRLHRASSSSATGRELLAEATVKVEVDGEIAPHRRRRERPGQRARRRPAQGAPRVLPGARRRPPRRLQGAHPRRRGGDRRPGPGSSSTRRTAPGPGPRWAATRTSSRPRRRPSPTRSSTRSGRRGAELRRRDERHFTTASDARADRHAGTR